MLPREKLVRLGLAKLSNSELLTLIYNTGSRKEPVTALTQRILQQYNSGIYHWAKDYQLVSKSLGLTTLKSMQLVATLELGRRLFASNDALHTYYYRPEQVQQNYQFLAAKTREEFWAIFLNSQQQFLADELIALGGLTSIQLNPRELVIAALRHNAANVILLHNHPSGSLEPSDADLLCTTKLREALALVGITLEDHLIISKEGFTSLEALGQLG